MSLAKTQRVYSVEDLVAGQGTTAHVARIIPYAVNSIWIPDEVRDIVTTLKSQGEF